MEIWIWISLYIVQTILGAVFYRKYQNDFGKIGETPQSALILSATVFINIIGLVALVYHAVGYCVKKLFLFIDFLAGVKNKTEEK